MIVISYIYGYIEKWTFLKACVRFFIERSEMRKKQHVFKSVHFEWEKRVEKFSLGFSGKSKKSVENSENLIFFTSSL